MMKGGLGGGSKKEGKMRIRAFPVSDFFLYLFIDSFFLIHSVRLDDYGRKVCRKYMGSSQKRHSRNTEEEQFRAQF